MLGLSSSEPRLCHPSYPNQSSSSDGKAGFMVVLILERVPPGLKGDLSRWMIEPKAGIFLGRVSARVRDEPNACRR